MQTLPLNMFKTGTGAGGKAAGTVVWVVPAEKGYCSLSPQCRCIVAVVSKRPSHVLPASKLSELLRQSNLHNKCQRKKISEISSFESIHIYKSNGGFISDGFFLMLDHALDQRINPCPGGWIPMRSIQVKIGEPKIHRKISNGINYCNVAMGTSTLLMVFTRKNGLFHGLC